MKLSAAIRIGSMTTKQIKANLIDNNNGACALGAAMSANGLVGNSWKVLIDKYPFLLDKGQRFWEMEDRYTGFPTGQNQLTLGGLVTGWNDEENYSREEIAERIEMVEEAQEYFILHGRESVCPSKKFVHA